MSSRAAMHAQAKLSERYTLPPAVGSIAYILQCVVSARLLNWPFVCLFVCLFDCLFVCLFNCLYRFYLIACLGPLVFALFLFFKIKTNKQIISF